MTIIPYERDKEFRKYIIKRYKQLYKELYEEKDASDTMTKEAKRHGKSYTALLKIYVNTTRINIYTKLGLKVLFFFGTMGSLAAVVYLFKKTLDFSFDVFKKFEDLNDLSIEAILSVLTVLIPSITSVVVAFVKIPQIIARYLFNIKEDQYMSSVVKDIQDYDRAVLPLEHKLDEVLVKNKESTSESKDDVIVTFSGGDINVDNNENSDSQEHEDKDDNESGKPEENKENKKGKNTSKNNVPQKKSR